MYVQIRNTLLNSGAPYQPQYSRFCLLLISFCLSIYPFILASVVFLSHSLQTLYTAIYLLPKHEVEQ